MEEEMNKNWIVLKGIFQKFEIVNKNPCHPYLTSKEMEEFERKMKNSLRTKKLERILNKLS